MSTTPKKVLVVLAGTVLLGGGMGTAMAVVLPIAWYHLGEADGIPAGTPPILANIPTQDSVGSNDLTPYEKTPGQGSGPWYDHPGFSPLPTGSTHFVAFDYNQENYYHSATSVNTGTVNWGAEAWIRSGMTDNRVVLCNGRGSAHPNPGDNANGFEIFQYNGSFMGLLNGVAFVGSSPIVTNQWVHLALVNTNGTTTFYVNGAAAGSFGGNGFAPFDGLTVAAGQAGDAGVPGSGGISGFWSGGLDEVRFFTFAQGAFSTSDLLYPTVPEPAMLSLLGLALLGLWRRRA